MSEIINIGTIANDGTGDTLRGAGEKINANFALPHFGIYDYADLATQTTPIELNALNSFEAILTNDTLGVNTNTSYGLAGVGIWEEGVSSFDFSDLELGDELLFRIDLNVTTTAINQIINLFFILGFGSGSSYQLNICPEIQYKTVSTYRIVATTSVYLGNNITKDFPALLNIKSDDDATVKVNGFYIKASKRTV